MSSAVLDSSAVLAIFNEEPGADKLTPELLIGAVASTVNAAEVQTKLVEAGVQPRAAWIATRSIMRQVIPFTPEQAKTAGTLVSETRPFGLSLEDRACLALALELGAPVYTADRSWKNLKVGVRIHLIR